MQFVALASTRMPDTATRATVAVAWLHCDFMMLHPHCLWPTVKINQNSFSSDNKVKYDICFLPLYPTPCTHTGCLLLHWAVGREEVTVRNTSMTATEADGQLTVSTGFHRKDKNKDFYSKFIWWRERIRDTQPRTHRNTHFSAASVIHTQMTPATDNKTVADIILRESVRVRERVFKSDDVRFSVIKYWSILNILTSRLETANLSQPSGTGRGEGKEERSNQPFQVVILASIFSFFNALRGDEKILKRFHNKKMISIKIINKCLTIGSLLFLT